MLKDRLIKLFLRAAGRPDKITDGPPDLNHINPLDAKSEKDLGSVG